MPCMKPRNQSKPPAWVVIIHVIGGISAGLLALWVIFLVSAGMVMEYLDHVRETPEWVEKNYRIPCESLQVKEAIFDMDSNELEVRLETSPSEQFDRALKSAGWKRCGRGYVLRQQENGREMLLWLEYYPEEQTLYSCIDHRARRRLQENSLSPSKAN